MILQIPTRGISYMVYEGAEKLRGFYTRSEAKYFVGNNKELSIVQLPQKFKTYEVEEAPF